MCVVRNDRCFSLPLKRKARQATHSPRKKQYEFSSFSALSLLPIFCLASSFVRLNFFRIFFSSPLLVHKVVGFISSFRNMFINMYDINKYMWKRRRKVD